MVNECDFLVWLDLGCYRSGSILRKSLLLSWVICSLRRRVVLHPEVGDVSTTDEQEMNHSPGSFTSSIVVPLAGLSLSAYLVALEGVWWFFSSRLQTDRGFGVLAIILAVCVDNMPRVLLLLNLQKMDIYMDMLCDSARSTLQLDKAHKLDKG